MSEVNLRPTQAMISAAKKGLRLHEEGKSGDGLKPETVAWARRVVNGDPLSEEKVRDMRAWFARHSKASVSPGWDKPGEEKPGYVAWLLWFGDAGKTWSEMKVAQLDKQKAEKRKFELLRKLAALVNKDRG